MIMHIVFAQPYGVFGSLVGKVGGGGEERKGEWLVGYPFLLFGCFKN